MFIIISHVDRYLNNNYLQVRMCGGGLAKRAHSAFALP